MSTPLRIDAFAHFVLDGENPAQVPVEGVATQVTSAEPPQPAPLSAQKPHFLTFDELIDEELIHNEVVNRDE